MGQRPAGASAHQPKDLFANSTAFGKTGRPLDRLSEDQMPEVREQDIRAAQLQHLVMNSVREQAVRQGHAGKDIATVCGIALGRYRKLASGYTMLTLADLVGFIQHYSDAGDVLTDFLRDTPAR